MDLLVLILLGLHDPVAPPTQMPEARLYLGHNLYVFCIYVVKQLKPRLMPLRSIPRRKYRGCPLGFCRLLSFCPPTHLFISLFNCRRLGPICPVTVQIQSYLITCFEDPFNSIAHEHTWFKILNYPTLCFK